MLVSEATRWSSSPEGGFEQSERLLKRKTMKRIGGLALMAACLGVLTSCSLGPGDRTHGENSGVSRDFSDIKSGGGSAVSGVADVTATVVGEIEPGGRKSSQSYGVLPPLGEFDRTVPGFQVFNPCVEIPSELFSMLGMEMISEPIMDSGYRSCHFSISSTAGSAADVSLVSQHLSMNQIRELYPKEFEGVEGADIQIYTVEDTFIAGVTCTSYVETVRGLFSVSWTDVGMESSMEFKCEQSRSVLKKLL